MNDSSSNLLISQLLNKNPSIRLGGSYSKLKSHPFFNHFDWVFIYYNSAFLIKQRNEGSVYVASIKDCKLIKHSKDSNKTSVCIFKKLW